MTSVVAPAPWNLKGSGYILLCRFSEAFVKSYTDMDERLKNCFTGGFGTLMLVDYESSDVGPYQELLLIPGRVRLDGKGYFHIPQIYVSSQASIDNGRRNWGIPKRLASFNQSTTSEGLEQVRVVSENQAEGLFRFKVKGPKMPFTTGLLPSAFKRLIQFDDDDSCLVTQISGSGKMQWLSVDHIELDAKLMAPVAKEHVVVGVKVPDFRLCFPEANTLDKQSLALS